MNFGQKVQQLRELHDWTQKELANQTGVTQASIARLESGAIRDPKSSGVMKLAKVLGVPVEVLLDSSVTIEAWQKEINAVSIDNEGRQLLRVYRGLKAKQKNLLLDFARMLHHQEKVNKKD